MEEENELLRQPREEEEQYGDNNYSYDDETKNNCQVPNPTSIWFSKMVSMQVEIFTTCFLSFVSPIFYILSFASDHPFLRPEHTQKNASAAASAAARVPSKVANGSALLLKKIAVGLLGAAYVGMILMTLMIVSGILGVGLVRYWVEEPVILREKLRFDYTELHPKAVFSFVDFGIEKGGFEWYDHNLMMKKKKIGVPIGHTLHVSVYFLMPESEFNRDVGVFQLNAEALSTEGDTTAKSSHPCMLRFRSLPIRLMREFIMSVPLVLGITAETQSVIVPILKHKEGLRRTEAIRITLIPRAGTFALPQLYESEIILKSHPPWWKDFVYRWKWTLYVWTSMYIYVSLLIILLSWFRPLVFPVIATSFKTRIDQDSTAEATKEPRERAREESDVSESLKRWRQSRTRRKAMLQQSVLPELTDSSASSISITREDTAASSEEDGENSESVCYRSETEW